MPRTLFFTSLFVFLLLSFTSLINLCNLAVPFASFSAFGLAFAQTPPVRPSTSALSDPLAPPKAQPLRVAHDSNFWPFSFKEKGVYVGFDIELWAALSENLGAEYIFEPMDFKEIIPAIEAGKLDLAIAAMPITAERTERVLFSIPYFNSGLQALCRKGEEIKKIEELKDKVIAVETGTFAAEYAESEFGTQNLRYCKYHDEMFFELLAGNVDAVFADRILLQAYLTTTKNPNLIIAAPLTKPYSIAIVMPKESPQQKNINKALASYRYTQEYKDLCLKWFGEVPKFK